MINFYALCPLLFCSNLVLHAADDHTKDTIVRPPLFVDESALKLQNGHDYSHHPMDSSIIGEDKDKRLLYQEAPFLEVQDQAAGGQWMYMGNIIPRRIHADGSYVDLGPLPGLPNNTHSGDFTATGAFFISGGGTTVYVIDVTTLAVTSFQTNLPFGAFDWAYRASDNTFYGASNGLLYALNATTHIMTITPIVGLPFGTYGSAFMTSNGDLYIANNNNGRIFLINIANLTAVQVAVGPSGLSQSDGAACPDAPSPFFPIVVATNDDICLPLQGSAAIDILINDWGSETGIDSNSYTLVTAPAHGSVVFNPLTGVLTYTPTGAPQLDQLTYAVCGVTPANATCDTATVRFWAPSTSLTLGTICDGDTFTFNGMDYLQAGDYTALLTNAKGCDSLARLSLSVLPLESNAVQVSICQGSAYTFLGVPYTTSGLHTQITVGSNGCPRTNTLQLTILQPITKNIAASICEGETYTVGTSTYSQSGNYTDVLTAANTCDSIVQLQLTIIPKVQKKLTIAICEGETYTVGTSTYSQSGNYVNILPNFQGCDSTIITELTVNAPSTTTIAQTTCLPAQVGTQITTLSNQFGCDSVVTIHTTLLPDNDCFVAAVAQANAPICNVPSGSFALVINTGTAPFNVFWSGASNGSAVVNTLNDNLQVTNLLPGNYIISITDANDLTLSLFVQINTISSPILTTTTSQFLDYEIACQGQTNGNAAVQVTAGVPPYDFFWSNSALTPSINNLSAGTYTVTVTDNNNCVQEASVLITEPAPLVLSFTVPDPLCFATTIGYLHADVTGGQPPYTYTLNGGAPQSTATFSSLSAGTYHVVVQDANGCSTTQSIWIEVPLPIEVNLGTDQSIILGDTIHLQAAVNIPISALSNVEWSGLGNTDCPECLDQIVRPFLTSAYKITVTDAYGCAATDLLIINVDNGFDIYAPNVILPDGDGSTQLVFGDVTIVR